MRNRQKLAHFPRHKLWHLVIECQRYSVDPTHQPQTRGLNL